MKSIQVIIPAAGYGTRLLPGSKSIPKEMFPIVNMPAIGYIADEVRGSGLTDMIIITAKNKDSVVDYFDRNFELEYILGSNGKNDLLKDINSFNDLNIVTIRQKEQRGLGHAVCIANKLVGDRPFIVSLPDMLIQNGSQHLHSMLKLFEQYGKGVIALMRVPKSDVKKYGIVSGVQKDDIFFIHDMVEKPDQTDAPSDLAIVGRYILPNKTMLLIEKTEAGVGGEIQLTDALKNIATTEGLIGYEIKDEIHDVGNPLGFIKANIAFGLRSKYRDDIIKYIKKIDNCT